MTTQGWKDRSEALVQAARDRSEKIAATLERRRGMPPAPGDLFVLPQTSEVPVEWAILERRTGSGDLLAVPADSHPMTGTGDVAVEPDGTPVLRCRYPVWFEPALFDPMHRSGVLPAETVASALQRVRQLETGPLEFSPLAEEVDRDPEYGDWLREVPERARSLAAGARTARPPNVIPRERRWMPALAPALAATFALASMGLSLYVLDLRREVDELSVPTFNLPSVEIGLGQHRTGGTTPIAFPSETKRLRLVFVVHADILDRARYLEISTWGGAIVKRFALDGLKAPGEVHLDLFRRQLPDGKYRVKVYPATGFSAPELYEETVVVSTGNSDSL